MSKTLTATEITQIQSLLTHQDEEFQLQGFELTKTLDDSSVIFEQCSIDANGKPVIAFGKANPSILHLWFSAASFDASAIRKLNLAKWKWNDIDFLHHLPHLEHLELQESKELETLNVLEKLTKLRFLNISNLPLLADISFLHHLPQLQTLLLSARKLKESYPPEPTNLMDFSAIASLTKLRTLDISHQSGLCDTHLSGQDKALPFLENLDELRNLNLQAIRPHGSLWLQDLQLRKAGQLQPRDLMSFERLDCIDTGISSGTIEGTGFVSADQWEAFLARVNHQSTPFAFAQREAPSVLMGRLVRCEDCQQAFVIDYEDDQFVSFEEDVAGLQKTDRWEAYYITLTASAWYSDPDLGGDGRYHDVCSSCESARDDYPDDYPDLTAGW